MEGGKKEKENTLARDRKKGVERMLSVLQKVREKHVSHTRKSDMFDPWLSATLLSLLNFISQIQLCQQTLASCAGFILLAPVDTSFRRLHKNGHGQLQPL